MEPEIGIIGGSGFYQFLQGKEAWVNTPYGSPSDKILLTEYAGRGVAFLPRHGRDHQLPPHQINYRANLFALKKLGVSRILAPTAVGSLKPEIKPGDFVICDQLIDQTKKRQNTFFNGPKTVHISFSEPYCPELRNLIIRTCQYLSINCHPQGTVAVIEGPRFSTKAESRFYSQSADVINMTQMPEAILARELGMCYANISIATDYDVGLKDSAGVEAVNVNQVKQIFSQNIERLKQLILKIIEDMPDDFNCDCQQALQNAVI